MWPVAGGAEDVVIKERPEEVHLATRIRVARWLRRRWADLEFETLKASSQGRMPIDHLADPVGRSIPARVGAPRAGEGDAIG